MNLEDLSPDELAAVLASMGPKLENAGRSAILSMQSIVHEAAVAAVPVRTGRARQAISSRPGTKPAFSSGDSPGSRPVSLGRLMSANVSSGARRPDGFPYAAALERRQPYLKPAVESLSGKADGILRTEFEKTLGSGAVD